MRLIVNQLSMSNFKIYFTKLIFITISFMLFSCKYDNENDLYPYDDCKSYDMSYGNDITPILQNYGCIGCHNTVNPQGAVNLAGYEQTKIWIDNTILVKSINHNGASPMPKFQAKMDSCDIKKIESWISDGARNN